VITSVHPLYLRSCRGCVLDKLTGSRVLFLREQVRDLRVQEFLREILVSVAAPGDLAGSILLKILHSVEGGTYSKCALTSKQFSRVCNCSSLSHLCLYIMHAFIVHLYMLDISCAKLLYMLEFVCVLTLVFN